MEEYKINKFIILRREVFKIRATLNQ